MWNPGDIVVWRGIYRQRVWHAIPTIVVRDTSEELALALLPGAEGFAPEGYAAGKQNGKRRWDFKDRPWALEQYSWHTNRLLILLEPQKYHSTMLFWHGKSNEFLCYYMNFQLPFQRSRCGIDSLDLDLDLIIYPDHSLEWKDEDDYRMAIEHEIIFPEWARGIEASRSDILDRLKRSHYPYDGSWLDWRPDPGWAAPGLPAGWDQVDDGNRRRS